MKRQEVEELLGFGITDKQLREALECARLTEEYVRSFAFSEFTMDLCSALHDMEKEHSANCQSAPTDNHIVAVPAG